MIYLLADTPRCLSGRIISLSTPQVVRTQNSCLAGPLGPRSYMPTSPQLYQLNSPFRVPPETLPSHSTPKLPQIFNLVLPVLSKPPSSSQTNKHPDEQPTIQIPTV